MTTLVLTTIAAYTIQALLVGAALAWLLAARAQNRLGLAGIAALIALFAALDLYWLPAVLALDLTVTIGNDEIARAIDATGPVQVESFLSYGWLDLLTWVAQAIAALVVSQFVLSRWGSAAYQGVAAENHVS